MVIGGLGGNWVVVLDRRANLAFVQAILVVVGQLERHESERTNIIHS